MIGFLFLILGQASPRSFVLENDGALLHYEKGNHLKWQAGSGLLIMSRHQVWHFDGQGHLLNRFGRAGQGPGEFSYIMCGIYREDGYWIVDGIRFTLSHFNRQGQWQKTYHQYYSDLFVGADQKVWAQIGGGFRQLMKERKKILVNLKLGPNGAKPQGAIFHMLPQRVPELSYEYTEPLWAEDATSLYIGCAVDPTIWVYSKQTQAKATELALYLPGFIADPPNKLPALGPGDVKKLWQWEDQFSQVTALARLPSGFAIQYTCPGDTPIGLDGKKRQFVLALFKEDGQLIGYGPIEALLLGTSQVDLVLLKDWDESISDRPRYELQYQSQVSLLQHWQAWK
ncbi:MAG: hypothetical protein H6510_02345 [Acidobacteria bacterium]|nr:hypothetical protein [Acidobacteriota bacterium]MCB9396634.1 hypothetical protein [Acidobacteriota bacterium]